MWWLQNANLGFVFATHTSVDWSDEVMKTWSYNHQQEALRAPVPVDYNPVSTYNGIQADVSDVTLLRATAHKSNLVMTLSPPCPSWSRGGKQSGLATDEGFCFLDAVEHLCRVRPILAIFECSDGLESHPHWRVISAAMQLAGFLRIWSQDVALHQITGNHRTRWLAVWCRRDVDAQKIGERIQVSSHHRVAWDDPMHRFDLPFSLVENLRLTDDQLNVYGDRNFLPPGKKVRTV